MIPQSISLLKFYSEGTWRCVLYRPILRSIIGCSSNWGKADPSWDNLNLPLEMAFLSSQETHSAKLETFGVICFMKKLLRKLYICYGPWWRFKGFLILLCQDERHLCSLKCNISWCCKMHTLRFIQLLDCGFLAKNVFLKIMHSAKLALAQWLR